MWVMFLKVVSIIFFEKILDSPSRVTLGPRDPGPSYLSSGPLWESEKVVSNYQSSTENIYDKLISRQDETGPQNCCITYESD